MFRKTVSLINNRIQIYPRTAQFVQCTRFNSNSLFNNDFGDVKVNVEKVIPEKENEVNLQSKKPFSSGVLINAYSEFGFRLNHDVKVIGPIAVFPRTVFSWNINTIEDINANSLCLFYMVKPKIDTLILGLGDKKITPAIGKTILEVTKKYHINIEILSTQQACTTFNFLSQQGRMVSAALIPPKNIKFSNDDVIATQSRDDKLFSIEKMNIIR